MQNYFAMSPGVQAFLGKEGAGVIDYGKEFGEQAVKDASENERAMMFANALQDIAKYRGEALQEKMKYRTEGDLLLKGPPNQSGFDRALNLVNMGADIAGGLKGLGAFGSGTPITDGFDGLGGFGPVASGDAYGGFLDATKGTTGMGPLMSGDAYGSFLSRQ